MNTYESSQNVQNNQITLGVEWGMTLMITLKGHTESHKATLVGMERGSYLICKTSSSHIIGIWAIINKKDFIIVRYINNGIVYGFHSTLIGAMDSPFSLLILSYPENIETVNLRQHIRIPCLIPAVLKINERTYKGAIIDISLSGSCFVFNLSKGDEQAQIQRGEEGALFLQIPGSHNEVTIKADMVSVRINNSKITIGTRFKELTTDAWNAIQNYYDTATLAFDISNP